MAFVLESRPYGNPDVARMVDEVQQEYVVRYGGPDGAEVEPADFAWPTGHFVVGLVDGEAAAMGGWRRLTESDAQAADLTGAGEVKRMYVRPAFRRRGLAQAVLAELERTAADAGLTRLVLSAGPAQPEALALYEARGYRPIEEFGYYAGVPTAVFLGKHLS